MNIVRKIAPRTDWALVMGCTEDAAQAIEWHATSALHYLYIEAVDDRLESRNSQEKDDYSLEEYSCWSFSVHLDRHQDCHIIQFMSSDALTAAQHIDLITWIDETVEVLQHLDWDTEDGDLRALRDQAWAYDQEQAEMMARQDAECEEWQRAQCEEAEQACLNRKS
jgi:hypothetical protein